jgi:sigma-B regulation protein RsbU (phosphoserine phosphatase)
MQVTPPGLTADNVLSALKSDAFTTFLGVAIATTGLVAAAFAALRRKRALLLVYFAVFAILYGTRMCIQTRTAEYIFYGSRIFFRIRSAINFLVPIPAFLFFDAAGFLRRKVELVAYIALGAFGLLAVATLITGFSNFYQRINDVLVIGVLLLLFTESAYDPKVDRDFILARRGLLIFAAFALWANIVSVLRINLPNVEPFGFVVLLACLGYVAARQTLRRDQQLAEISKELEVARRIQLSILPSEFPTSGKFRVAARYVPMTSVAGDFYDFVLSDDTRAGLLIADVSGHGVPAALIASMVKLAATSQRTQASDPAALLSGMNAALHGNTQSQFVTAAYVYLDAQREELRYSAAGHPPMLLLRNGAVSEIAENGLILAAFDFAAYESKTHRLQPKDRLLLYTDGIIEAANAAGEFFGADRLSQVLRESAAVSAHETADQIIRAVRGWATTQDDDLTVLVCDYAA